MKLPVGPQPTTPNGHTSDTLLSTGTSSAAKTPEGLSARQLLDALQLANRETVLAKVAEITTRQGNMAPEVLLDVRGKPLLVEAAIGKTPIEVGDWVKVMRAGNELQLMGKLAAPQEANIARTLVQKLPWQHNLESGLAKLVSSLTQGIKPELSPGQLPSAREATPLPEPARQAIAQIIARLPSRASFTPGQGSEPQTPQQIKQWISESGLFTEARLAQAPKADQPALPDLKLAIGRAITALLAQPAKTSEAVTQFNRLVPLTSPELIQAPLQFPLTSSTTHSSASSSGNAEPTSVGQMLRMLAGMLNRITVNQLHSQSLNARAAGDPAAPASTLLLELPWMTPQNEPKLAQLRLEQYPERNQRENNGQKTQTAEWRLSLAIDLDDAGPLHFDVALRQESVSARVWASEQNTLKRVNEELPLLRKSLSDLGLEVTELDCRHGSPQATTTRLEHRLVDTRA